MRASALERSPALSDLHKELHVFTAEVTTELSSDAIKRFESWLCDDETRRYRRYLRRSDRDLFLVAHALLRHSLSMYADIDPGQWRFELGEHGRPELTEPFARLGLRFNISHSSGLVAVLVSDGIDAGVDIESRGRVDNLATLARRVFSNAQLLELEGLDNDAFRRRFFEFWTLSEAYLKAKGLGLEIPLRDVLFSIGPNSDVGAEFSVLTGYSFDDWQFSLWQPTNEHQGAIALRSGAGQERSVVFRQGFADIGG